MIQKPRVKTFLTVFPINETTWGLRGGLDELSRIRLVDERAIRTFSGLLPFLNGQHHIDEILEQLEGQGINRQAASKLIEQLETASLIEEAETFGLTDEQVERYGGQLSFFSRYTSAGGAKFQRAICDTTVAVVGMGPLADRLRRQLEEAGFGQVLSIDPAPSRANGNGSADPAEPAREAIEQVLKEAGALDPAPAVVFVPQEAHDPLLCEAMDAFSKEHKVSWMLVRALDTHEGWVGPLFVPDESACYQSLEARFRANVPFYNEYQAFYQHLRTRRTASAPCGGLHAFLDLLSAIAVIEAAKHVSGVGISHLMNRFLTVNLANWEVEAHDVLAVPHLGLEADPKPTSFPWKEVPYDAIETQRDDDLPARRG